MKYLHFSLHDVAPCHLERLQKAELLFEKWGVQKVTYLLVPDFHHRGLANESIEFMAFVQKQRKFEVEWALHGEFHMESEQASQRIPSPDVAWKRKHMTGGEGEFLALQSEEIRSSLIRGINVFEKCLGFKPQIFIPPAWLYNEQLAPELKSLNFEMTEDHFGIHLVQESKVITAPVVTWATRTLLRRWGSWIVCPVLARLAKSKPLLRIACHPMDFEFDWTVRSLGMVFAHSRRRRKEICLGDIKNLTLGAKFTRIQDKF